MCHSMRLLLQLHVCGVCPVLCLSGAVWFGCVCVRDFFLPPPWGWGRHDTQTTHGRTIRAQAATRATTIRKWYILCVFFMVLLGFAFRGFSAKQSVHGTVCVLQVWNASYALGCGHALCTTNSPFGTPYPWHIYVCVWVLVYKDGHMHKRGETRERERERERERI